MRLLRKFLFILFLLQCIIGASLSAATKSEAEVKALFLCTLLKYTKFPDSRQGFTVGVVGDNPFDGGLKALQGRKIKGRTLRVLFLRDAKDQNISSCHVIFVTRDALNHDKKILEKIGLNTLTVGSNKWFLRHGGLINVVFKKQGLRWEVNYKELEKRPFSVSSKILRVALNRKER